MPDNINPQDFGEMKADVKNMSATQEIMREDFKTATGEIKQLVGDGFKKQGKVNEKFDERITWNMKKIYWIIGLLISSGILGGAGWKVFG